MLEQSLSTGPSDITGGGNYLFIETSSPRLLGMLWLFTKHRFKYSNCWSVKIFICMVQQ